MGLKEFNITFDNPYRTYYVGQTVTGRLEVVLDSPKKIRGILLKFKGEAKVRWTEHESRTNQEGKSETQSVSMTGDEEYFKTQYYCFGGANADTTELPIGSHIYPFTCVLPPNLPSSFEDEYGYIRYTIKAIIDRPWKFDHETKQAFTVLSQYDLNSNPKLSEQAKITMEKFMCCCWCQSGPLSCVVTLPKAGYVPGEAIPILAEVDNNSNVTVSKIKFELQKVITCYSQFPRRDSKKSVHVVAVLAMGPINNNSLQLYTPTMTLPPLPPSNLVHCNIIDLDYALEIVLDIDGCHSNLSKSIPISIGTIPLKVSPSAPPLTPPPSEGGPLLGWVLDGQAPTFGMYNYGATNLQDRDDNQHTMFDTEPFHPMYPVYKFTNGPQS
nr:arrestin domain-containing protein 17-like [Onthophagus taurus]